MFKTIQRPRPIKLHTNGQPAHTIQRLHSIDVFRAITMLLMVFVNDVDEVNNIPVWIKHVKRDADGLGFADTIFPAFLFIVGLSIPYAISNRIKKGATTSQVIFYILSRSLALLIMGFIHMNLEHYSNAAILPKAVFEIVATLCFFLIWLDYPKTVSTTKRYLLQGIGLGVLVLLCFLYKGNDQGQIVGLKTYWWGILGLIGWSYLICSSIYFLSKGLMPVLIAAFLFFFLFDIATHAGWITDLHGLKNYIWIVGSASMPSLTMAGVVLSTFYMKMSGRGKINNYWLTLIPIGIAMLALGFIIRPYTEGISKIRETPSWVAICIGISILVFAMLIVVVDINKKERWFNAIKPAGTSTLTCYLIPYILYSLFELINFHYPTFFNEGAGGILRSFIVAFSVVLFTGFLEKKHIRVRV
jgi:predicted acyltransferase